MFCLNTILLLLLTNICHRVNIRSIFIIFIALYIYIYVCIPWPYLFTSVYFHSNCLLIRLIISDPWEAPFWFGWLAAFYRRSELCATRNWAHASQDLAGITPTCWCPLDRWWDSFASGSHCSSSGQPRRSVPIVLINWITECLLIWLDWSMGCWCK